MPLPNLFNITFLVGGVKAVRTILRSYLGDKLLLETGDSLLLENGGVIFKEQQDDISESGDLLQSNGDLLLLS
jgi:hypothetical protein